MTKAEKGGRARRQPAESDPATTSRSDATEPKVKSLAPSEGKVKTPAKSADVYTVILSEGARYTVGTIEFINGQGKVISDPKILANVLRNNRFRCSPLQRSVKEDER